MRRYRDAAYRAASAARGCRNGRPESCRLRERDIEQDHALYRSIVLLVAFSQLVWRCPQNEQCISWQSKKAAYPAHGPAQHVPRSKRHNVGRGQAVSATKGLKETVIKP